MYNEFERVARDEGFLDIAQAFKLVANIEKHHEERYNALISNIENDEVFKKSETVVWQCRNCGHIHTGTSAPNKCPVCQVEQAYFQIYPENY